VVRTAFTIGEPLGAVELAARISELTLDAATFTDAKGVVDSGLPIERPGEQGHGVTLGVNWYLTQNVEWCWTILRPASTRRQGRKDRADEKAFFTRSRWLLAISAAISLYTGDMGPLAGFPPALELLRTIVAK